MRVLLLVSEYDPHGGVERVVHRLVRMMHDQCDIEVVLTGRTMAQEELSRVAVHHLGNRRLRSLLPALRRRIVEADPDVVISFKDHANIAVMGAARLARSRARIVLCVHVPLLRPGEHRAGAVGFLLPFLASVVYRRSNAIIAVSPALQNELVDRLRVPRSLVHMIENPIIDEHVQPSSAPSHPWFGDADRPTVVAVGRLEAIKDHSTLLRGMAALVDRVPARLLVIGDGTLRRQLEDEARQLDLESSVQFLGTVPDARPWICGADLLASTSRSESVPTVVVEALWCRTPVVTTDSGSFVREVIPDERSGVVVPVGDAERLAESMEALLIRKTQPPARADLVERFGVEGALARYRVVLSALARGA